MEQVNIHVHTLFLVEEIRNAYKRILKYEWHDTQKEITQEGLLRALVVIVERLKKEVAKDV